MERVTSMKWCLISRWICNSCLCAYCDFQWQILRNIYSAVNIY